MESLPSIEPMPPTASIVLPWDAAAEAPSNPVSALAAARARHGDTFIVDSGGTRYLFLFSPAGVRAFYALPERRASKGLADCRMLLRKLPEELFLGRRTFAHDLFSNEASIDTSKAARRRQVKTGHRSRRRRDDLVPTAGAPSAARRGGPRATRSEKA